MTDEPTTPAPETTQEVCPVCGETGHQVEHRLGITFILCPTIPAGGVQPVSPRPAPQEG